MSVDGIIMRIRENKSFTLKKKEREQFKNQRLTFSD